jgi:nucleoid-associated protein YgaU
VTYDAFISFEPRRSADARAAALIDAALKRVGLTAWTYSLAQPGRDRFKAVVHGLRRSKCVVAVVSGTSLQSKWRNGELFMGHSEDAVIPVLVGVQAKKLPFGLANTTPIAYSTAALPQIVAAVHAFKSASAQRIKASPALLTTSDFLGAVGKWPPLGVMGSAEGREGLQEALKTLCQNTQLVQACTDYEHMTRIGPALSDIEQRLDVGGRREEWMALAVIAQPFNPTMMAYALVRAEIPDAELADVLGETRQAAEQNFMLPPETAAEMLAEVVEQVNALSAVAPPPPPAAPPQPPPPPAALPPPPQPARVTPPAEPAGAVETSPNDGGGCVIVAALIFIVGGIALVLFLGNLLWKLFFGAPPVPPPSAPAAVTNTTPAPAPVAPPQRVLTYCQADLSCRFPRGHSFARVARECYGHDKFWPEIWEANRTKPVFAARNPEEVFDGEAFQLPRPCNP